MTFLTDCGNSVRNGLGPAGLSKCFIFDEFFGLLIKSRLSRASFSACCEGMRRMPWRTGVAGWL